MQKEVEKQVLGPDGIERTLQRISHEIVEKNPRTQNLAIIGIRTRGACLAERIARNIEGIEKTTLKLGAIDITLYRDDLTEIAEQPVIHATDISFDINGKNIVLVDDVLFTGRTVRCALDELIDYGRPSRIQLAVLIDRGHRELPIRPDYIGKNIPTAVGDNIEVRLKDPDGTEEVLLISGGKNR